MVENFWLIGGYCSLRHNLGLVLSVWAFHCFKINRKSCGVRTQLPRMSEKTPEDHHFLWDFVSKSQTMSWSYEPGGIVAVAAIFLPDDTADVATITANPGDFQQNPEQSGVKRLESISNSPQFMRITLLT